MIGRLAGAGRHGAREVGERATGRKREASGHAGADRHEVGWPDLVAPLFFLLCWVGYSAWPTGRSASRRSLMSRIHEHRRLWMRRMLARENRIGDMQVVMILAQSNAFFASTSLLIVGGCLAILGARDQAMTDPERDPGRRRHAAASSGR